MEQKIIASSCPHCSSNSIVRNGHKSGIQRYKCNNCKKTFQDTTGTPSHWLHKKTNIEKYLEALYQGLSVRKAATYAGISKTTSFNWRHKFLSSLTNIKITRNDNEVCGIKIITLPYSDKGRKKSAEKNTKPTRTLLINHNEQIQLYKFNLANPIKEAANILQKLKSISILPNRILSKTFKRTDNQQCIQHKKLQKEINLKTQNQETDITIWMNRFHGVASKYLQQYWNWYTTLKNIKLFKEEFNVFSNKCIKNRSLMYYRELINT